MILQPIPNANYALNVMVADGCVAAVPSLDVCDCCLLINLTFVLASLGVSRGLNSNAVAKVQLSTRIEPFARLLT
jgi:hypothetical protein